MNAPLATRSWRADFPGVADWHYLDTAATAQKPQQVVDAITRAYGVDYATVHRGVYARSANMTLAYEAARRRVAQFIGAASDRSEEHTSELQSLMRISYAVFCLKKKNTIQDIITNDNIYKESAPTMFIKSKSTKKVLT